MYDKCMYDRYDECLHDCPKCPQYIKVCKQCDTEIDEAIKARKLIKL